MSVTPGQLVIVGSANMPDVDGSAAGGAVNFATIMNFNDVTPAQTVNYVSSSASDTAATLTATGRDNSGVIQNETKTLNGTTAVSGSQTFERLLKGVAGGTTMVGDGAIISSSAVVTGTAQAGAAASSSADATITLASGQGASCAAGMVLRITNNVPSGVANFLRRIISLNGDVASVNRDWGTVPTSSTTYSVYHGQLFDISPNQVTQNRRPFYNVASDISGGSTRIYYEKGFVVNNNTATTATSANIIKQVDPSAGTLDFALANALNDTATVANRQTAPSSGITAFSSGTAPQTIAVPSPQNLPAGTAPNSGGAQAVWWRLTLSPGLAATKTSFSMRVAVQTT